MNKNPSPEQIEAAQKLCNNLGLELGDFHELECANFLTARDAAKDREIAELRKAADRGKQAGAIGDILKCGHNKHWLCYYGTNCMACRAERAESDLKALQATDEMRSTGEMSRRIAEIEKELSKCGKENCFGHEVDGCRRWVSKESSDALKARIAELEAAVQGRTVSCVCGGRKA